MFIQKNRVLCRILVRWNFNGIIHCEVKFLCYKIDILINVFRALFCPTVDLQQTQIPPKPESCVNLSQIVKIAIVPAAESNLTQCRALLLWTWRCVNLVMSWVLDNTHNYNFYLGVRWRLLILKKGFENLRTNQIGLYTLQSHKTTILVLFVAKQEHVFVNVTSSWTLVTGAVQVSAHYQPRLG